MTDRLQVVFEGRLSVAPESDRCRGATSALTGPIFELALLKRNTTHVDEASSIHHTIISTDWEALPTKADLRARVFYVRYRGEVETPYQVRFTYDDDTTETLSVTGCLLREADSSNAIKMTELKGAGTYEWFVAGNLA